MGWTQFSTCFFVWWVDVKRIQQHKSVCVLNEKWTSVKDLANLNYSCTMLIPPGKRGWPICVCLNFVFIFWSQAMKPEAIHQTGECKEVRIVYLIVLICCLTSDFNLRFSSYKISLNSQILYAREIFNHYYEQGKLEHCRQKVRKTMYCNVNFIVRNHRNIFHFSKEGKKKAPNSSLSGSMAQQNEIRHFAKRPIISLPQVFVPYSICTQFFVRR